MRSSRPSVITEHYCRLCMCSAAGADLGRPSQQPQCQCLAIKAGATSFWFLVPSRWHASIIDCNDAAAAAVSPGGPCVTEASHTVVLPGGGSLRVHVSRMTGEIFPIHTWKSEERKTSVCNASQCKAMWRRGASGRPASRIRTCNC